MIYSLVTNVCSCFKSNLTLALIRLPNADITKVFKTEKRFGSTTLKKKPQPVIACLRKPKRILTKIFLHRSIRFSTVTSNNVFGKAPWTNS